MKVLFIFVIITGCVFLISCFTPKVNFSEDPDDGIQFKKESWAEILTIAKAENKVIFLDIYASWCGPCKRLKAHTFSDPVVGHYFNENFINVAIDGEKGEGPKIAQVFDVRGYPTLLFLDPHGNVISREMGYKSSQDLLKIAKVEATKTINN